MIQVSDDPNRDDQARAVGTLQHDFSLLREEVDFSLFYYGPAEWRVGYTEPHAALEGGGEEARVVLERLIENAPKVQLPAGSILYRIRLGEVGSEPTEFDPPPSDKRRPRRFDTADLEILYTSPDIETCLHECRVTVVDEIVLATLATRVPLSLLDLAGDIKDPSAETPFEDIRVTLATLFYSGEHEYECCRKIAGAIHAAGYDGFVYPSYFSFVRAGSSCNIALFGRPLEKGTVAVQSLNRLCLSKVTYSYELGPAEVEITA